MRNTFLAMYTILAIPFLVGAVSAKADEVHAPDAAIVEAVLRQALESDRTDPYALVGLRHARLLDFTVTKIETEYRNRWSAIATIVIDYGPAPKAVYGFERIRDEEFVLVIVNRGGSFELKRLYRAYGARLLPAAK